MVQYKEQIHLIVVIISLISLSSCAEVKNKETIIKNKITQFQKKDTLFLSSKDYKIISYDENVLDIEVTNDQKVFFIKNKKIPFIKIDFSDYYIIVKGHDLLNSSVPNEHYYFYPLDKGYILFINNRINLRRIIK